MSFQFTLRRLFVAVTLVAVGIGMAWPQYRARTDVILALPSLLWELGGVLIGAGIGQLHQQQLKGAMAGAAIGLAVQLYLELQGALVGHI
jgi:hypothetical protein